MNDNGQFSSGQSGFLRLHSTVTCLLNNTDDWYNGMDLEMLVGLVYIDLNKAFDTVDHNILCKKLELYGVQQRELAWFKSGRYRLYLPGLNPTFPTGNSFAG